MREPLVLFDGVCNFCNYWMQFALKRDRKGHISFGSLQGKTAHEILPHYGIDPAVLTSVILIENGKAWKASGAVLRICRHLNGLWKLLYIFIVIPAPIRDAVYNWVGKNRYRWFGKKENCMIPTPEQRERFVD